jgi:hypothetical protein
VATQCRIVRPSSRNARKVVMAWNRESEGMGGGPEKAVSRAGHFGFGVQHQDQQVVQSAQVVEVATMGGKQVRWTPWRIGFQQAARIGEQGESVTDDVVHFPAFAHLAKAPGQPMQAMEQGAG